MLGLPRTMGKGLARQWAIPIIVLGSLALVATVGLYSIDHYLVGQRSTTFLSHYLRFSPEAVSNSVGVLSSIIAAVLGIVLTVVSIVVQLTATRYSPAVTELFLQDRTNIAVMGLYVIACVMGFWIAFAVNDDWVPQVSLIAMLTLATFGFLLMAPYFAYVFRLLAPQSVIERIETHARLAVVENSHPATVEAVEKQQREFRTKTEQLTDIAINSILQKDKIIAIAAVDALRNFSLAYLDKKKQLREGWFQLTRTIKHDPDFASMAKDSVQELAANRTWVEFKILRQYQSVFTEALVSMRRLNYVIAINTRLIAQRALQTDNVCALELTIKFFNTYLRATLNKKDVRTAYTILNQYRLLAESVIKSENGEIALRIVNHFRYYAHLSHEKHLGFVTETIAYDVGSLCELAHNLQSPLERPLLNILLQVDPTTSEGDVQEASLRGVRKAQLKLATFYLANGAENLAREVFKDMRTENVGRMCSIRDELMAIKSKDYWEVSDRGDNFEYLPPDRKEMLLTFFEWFPDLSRSTDTVSLASTDAEVKTGPDEG